MCRQKEVIVDIKNYEERLDINTLQHMKRVSLLCGEIAEELRLNKRLLMVAGYYHDIGKSMIPSSIILKKGPLTSYERKIIDCHAIYSYQILKECGYSQLICEAALLHHGVKPEWHLKTTPSKESVLYGNVIRAADFYDALTSDRSYHKGKEKEDVIKIMKQERFNTTLINTLDALPV